MLDVFNSLRTVTLLSITVRMTLSALCGGIIGIEREYKRRPAGFRTHILICLGASITMLTSGYLCFYMGYDTDIGRLGAQVVAGISFIGAGTIIVTRRQRVKGLTTAAGLWTTAIIGLCIGSGFYEGGLYATALVLAAELFFSKLEYRILSLSPELNLYIEYADVNSLNRVLSYYHDAEIRVLGMEITRAAKSGSRNACAIFALGLGRKNTAETVMNQILMIKGVIMAEEL